LLKPVCRKRLEDALSRAERLQTSERWQDYDSRLGQLLDWLDSQSTGNIVPTSPPKYIERISIPYRDRVLLVNVDKLVSAEIIDGITRLFVLADEATPGRIRSRLHQYVVSYTLEYLVAHLDPSRFMRIHRSTIVRLDSIQEMIPWFSGRYKLVLDGKHEVIASRERSRLLKERLMI